MKILFLGDINGRVGRLAVAEHLPQLRKEFALDCVIANGENAAGGVGIDPATAEEIFNAGVDVMTSGNHIWHRKEIFPLLEEKEPRIIRPMNYAPGAPGKGFLVWRAADGTEIALMNVAGRVFMSDLVDCPFRAVDDVIANILGSVAVRVVDFHAEATSEKVAFGRYLAGRASLVVGTHTHVQTADETVLTGGTAYITDVGMCGAVESVIGVEPSDVIERFVSGLPHRFTSAKGKGMVNGVVVEVDKNSGHAKNISRIYRQSSSAAV